MYYNLIKNNLTSCIDYEYLKTYIVFIVSQMFYFIIRLNVSIFNILF